MTRNQRVVLADESENRNAAEQLRLAKDGWYYGTTARLPNCAPWMSVPTIALVATPELMALLAENTALAVLLGDAYEREPEVVIAWLAGTTSSFWP